MPTPQIAYQSAPGGVEILPVLSLVIALIVGIVSILTFFFSRIGNARKDGMLVQQVKSIGEGMSEIRDSTRATQKMTNDLLIEQRTSSASFKMFMEQTEKVLDCHSKQISSLEDKVRQQYPHKPA